MATTIDFSVGCLEEAGTYDVVLDAAYYQRAVSLWPLRARTSNDLQTHTR